MSTLEERRATASAGVQESTNGVATRVFLQPIAAPAIPTVAALAESLGLTAVLSTLAAGSGILAGAFIYGSHGWTEVAGWVLVFSAGFAWYTVAAMLLASATGRTVLPMFKYKRAAN